VGIIASSDEDHVNNQASTALLHLYETSQLQNVTPRLVFAHFAKCGGTFSKPLVALSVPGVTLNDEGTPFQKVSLAGQATFTIALMRNPYNYLVAMWSMYVSGRGAVRLRSKESTQDRFTIHNVSTLGASVEDRNNFRDWVRYFSTEDLGFVSSRFATKYLENITEKETRIYPGFSIDRDKLVLEKLQQLNIYDIADCWVYTEHLVDDLVYCLGRFESTGGVVDWKAFNNSINSMPTNYYSHVSCSKMFSDPQLKSYVAENEHLLIKKFGYAVGCS